MPGDSNLSPVWKAAQRQLIVPSIERVRPQFPNGAARRSTILDEIDAYSTDDGYKILLSRAARRSSI